MHRASPPTYLALHEFDAEGLESDSVARAASMEGDRDRKIREGMLSDESLQVRAAR